MSSTPETVKAQLRADIAAANAATGKEDATMHDAVNSLIEGFGQGEEVFWADPNTTAAGQPICMYTRNVIFPHESGGIHFSQCAELETFEAPYLTTITNGYAFFNCAKLRSIKLPRFTKMTATYFLRQQGVQSVIEEIQFGSIGYPFTQLANNWNYGNNHQGCTITFYVNASTIEEAHASITAWATYGGQNTSKCTLVFRNSTTGEVITE